jgi:hypothetical protein
VRHSVKQVKYSSSKNPMHRRILTKSVRGGGRNRTGDVFDIPFGIYKEPLRKTLTMIANPE